MPIYERKETHFTTHPEAFAEGDTVRVETVHTGDVRPLFRVAQIVWALLYVIETVLLFRFILKLIGANTGASFTTFIYSFSHPFVAPFLGVVRSPQAFTTVFEWSTLLAMLVWWLVAWGIIKLLAMSRPVTRTEAHQHLEEQEPMN
jgi:hypothetical protein